MQDTDDKAWGAHLEFLKSGYNALKLMCELQQIEIAGLKQQCKNFENDADYYRSICTEVGVDADGRY